MISNYELQQYFLDTIKEFAISNPTQEITDDFVYSNLVRFNIRNDQMPFQNVRNFFAFWKDRYQNNPNIEPFEVENRKAFLWFQNGEINGNEIKLYVPLDVYHLLDGANMLFDFIAQENIVHQSKIADKIRNDNVVIRVTKLEDAEKIVNFVRNNGYMQEGMMKVNPFLPNMAGVGLAMDNSRSFNSTLSEIICDFVNYLKRQNRLNALTVENLNNYIKSRINSINDLDLRDIYELLSKTTSKNFKAEDFFEFASNKIIDKYDNDRNRITDPKFYFETALKITEQKYPGNSKPAILAYLKGDANYFTNQENARNGLIKYVRPGDLISLMRSKLLENGLQIPRTDNELIDNYLDIVFGRKMQISGNDFDFNIIKNAYISTLNVHGFDQAEFALQDLLYNNNARGFTNQFGDRTRLKELLQNKKDIKRIILSNIDITNLNVGNINEIVTRFKTVVFPPNVKQDIK